MGHNQNSLKKTKVRCGNGNGKAGKGMTESQDTVRLGKGHGGSVGAPDSITGDHTYTKTKYQRALASDEAKKPKEAGGEKLQERNDGDE